MSKEVAWMNDSGSCFLSDGNKYNENWTALYTSPPKREPLSEVTLRHLFAEAYCNGGNISTNFARAIEKAHGIGETND